MLGYEIDKVIVVRLNNEHIPYIKGLLVIGPKGGKYLLDEFNSEILVKNIIKNDLRLLAPFDFRIANLLIGYGMVKKRVLVLNQDELSNRLGERLGARVLARKAGIDTVNTISKNNDYTDLRNYIIDRNEYN